MHPIHSIRLKTHVLGRFGPFCYSTKVVAKLADQVPLTPKFAKRNCFPIFSQRTHLIVSIGPKTHVLGRFGPFRYCTKVSAKLAEQVPLTHKFAKQCRLWIFHNERTRSTPLDPKLMFWSISYCFITARKWWEHPSQRYTHAYYAARTNDKSSCTRAKLSGKLVPRCP
jgi:hypothetical protein